MRPSSSSEAMAKARISFSVKSLNFFCAILSWIPLWERRIAQTERISHPPGISSGSTGKPHNRQADSLRRKNESAHACCYRFTLGMDGTGRATALGRIAREAGAHARFRYRGNVNGAAAERTRDRVSIGVARARLRSFWLSAPE